MVDQVANFKKVTVSTGYNNTATSIVLATGQGAELPDPSGDNYNVVWWDSTNYNDPADDPNVEIVRVTAKSTDTLTVTRNQEGSGASNKNNADATYKMILAPTAKTITDIISDVVLNSDIKDQSFTNLLDNGNFESWSAGAAAVPDGWVDNLGDGSIARSTTKKIGTYSAEITKPSSGYGRIYHSLTTTYYGDRTLTFAMWIKSANTVAGKVLLQFYNGTDYEEALYQNSGDWELLTITRTLSSASSIRVYCAVSTDADAVAYFDGAILVEGSVCPAFSMKPASDMSLITSAPTDTGYDGEMRIYSTGGTRRLYISDGTDWKYISVAT